MGPFVLLKTSRSAAWLQSTSRHFKKIYEHGLFNQRRLADEIYWLRTKDQLKLTKRVPTPKVSESR